jgi:V/A-type H+-transporting ATPase subunit D
MEVKKARDEADRVREKLDARIARHDHLARLWGEFDPDVIKISSVDHSIKKIAGVNTPVLQKVSFDITPFSLFNQPGWFPDGVTILKEVATLSIERDFYVRKMLLLDQARKKTTQKVNLYEKVQIPAFQEAIRKIKRFLEDEENLSKSSQKIVKKRQQEAEEVQL